MVFNIQRAAHVFNTANEFVVSLLSIPREFVTLKFLVFRSDILTGGPVIQLLDILQGSIL